MRNRINNLWNRASRIGLREEEGVLDSREVILLNRILVITPLVLLAYMPLEIYFNGISMLHLVGIFVLLLLLPLYLNHLWLFSIARYLRHRV